MPNVTEMTSNPQQLQTQLVVAQDAVASWDSLREVSFFLVSMVRQMQQVNMLQISAIRIISAQT